ncbi:MAG TPA: choice-of-anchor D domain-containing protein, partial [Blastocatellia bacterium]|nr:choice-of-anchor D domain-containing protein [Blastocatellia bacterium]
AVAKTPANPVPVNPVIVVDPTSLDFGSVRVTQSDTKTVTVTNAGGADLIISAINGPAGAFSIVDKPAVPLTIPTTQSITLTVRFSPIVVGPTAGSFDIQSNDPGHPFVTVNLSGVGAAAPVPNLDVNPGFVNFGTSTAPKTVEITNTGEADLIIATVLPPGAPFGLSGSPVGTLKFGEKRTLTVTFTPTTLGVFSGGFSLLSNDPDTTFTFVALRGISTVPPPIVVGLQFKKKGLRFQASGSNVVSGAVLIVDGTQTFNLESNGDLWVVTKKAKSTPGNLRVRDIFTSPSTHTVIVRNPNGATSGPVTISV